MKRFYIVTMVMLLLLALFYWYGISVDGRPDAARIAAEASVNLK